MDFYYNFFKLRAFRTLYSLKMHVFLEILVEKAFHFSKRAWRAGTARNKRLK